MHTLTAVERRRTAVLEFLFSLACASLHQSLFSSFFFCEGSLYILSFLYSRLYLCPSPVTRSLSRVLDDEKKNEGDVRKAIGLCVVTWEFA